MNNEEQTALKYDSVMRLKGVDGYAVFNMRGEAVESCIPELFIYKLGTSLNSLLAGIHDNSENGFQSKGDRILLTEKGAWHISTLEKGVFVVLAGCKESVDITELNKVITSVKRSCGQHEM